MDTISITSIETVQALVARAEKEKPASEPSAAPVPARVSGFDNGSLGPLNVESYLAHYHVVIQKTKPTPGSGSGTMYILEHCLFNPDHKGGESAIIAWPDGLSYQCFHASCAGKTWKDARYVISGDEKIAQFCAGYDPNWKPKQTHHAATTMTPQKDLTGIYRTMTIFSPAVVPSCVDETTGNIIPSPLDVDPAEFYEKGKSNRVEFVEQYAAHYLAKLMQPISYTAGQFWRYGNGRWSPVPREELAANFTTALKSKIKSRMIDNVLTVLSYMIYKPEQDWDTQTMLINVQNGMYDIVNDTLLPHSPEYFSRVQLPVTYDKGSAGKIPGWKTWLRSVFPEDFTPDPKTRIVKNPLAKQILLQQFCGYVLLRDNRYQKALFLYGSGSNGKSTLLDIIGAVLGSENTVSLSLTSLGERFKAQYLHNKLVNLASETNPQEALESDIFNAAVAGDEITAEKKYGDSFKFRPFCKFMISMNEPPIIKDKSYAFQRRVLVLNFNKRFTKDEIDPMMASKLIAEKNGIFFWMVEGLQLLLRAGRFIVGENIQAEIDQMMERVNPLLTFVDEITILDPEHWTATMDFWEAYRDWCDEAGLRKLGRNKFFDQILALFPEVQRKHSPDGSRRAFLGIGINADAIDDVRARLRRRTVTRSRE